MRMTLAAIIAVTPFWGLRRWLFRTLLGYQIDRSSFVANFTLLLANSVTMREARIGMLNALRLDELAMDPGAIIGKLNYVSGTRRITLGPEAMILNRNFIGGTHGSPNTTGQETLDMGARSQLSIMTFVDLTDSIIMGEDVVSGGASSQFWTHGFDCYRKRSHAPIRIADQVFIGSAAIILPGVEICSEATIGAGTIVHKSITESGLYVSTQLVKR